MTPGSEILQTMADKLNREIPRIKNWHHLAYKLEVPIAIRYAIGGVGPEGKSPTKEVMQWLVARFPDTTLKDVVKALDKIQRNDAIQIITRQFPDTVGESRLLCCNNVSTILYIVSITTIGENMPRCRCMEEMCTLYFVCVMRQILGSWKWLSNLVVLA